MSGPVLAIDVGGTKLAAAVVEPDGTIRTRGWVATPPSTSAQVVTSALHDLVRQVTEEAPVDRLAAVGIGSAGPLDPSTGTVSPVNIPAWRGYGIVDALRAMVPGRPAVLAGDGHCMALGEYWRGGHRPADRVTRALLGVVVSTGVGGGLVIDGHVHSGPTGNAGHIGHIIVDLDGPPCLCGGRGCVEALASGPAMVRWARAQGWSPAPAGAAGDSLRGAAGGATGDSLRGAAGPAPDRPPAAHHGLHQARPRLADARTLAADARAGHPVARQAFARAGRALAAAVVSAAALIDLDDVVIGGGVAQAGELLFDPLLDAVADLAGMAFVRRVRIHPSPLGNDAGLLGAAALALNAAETG